MLASARAGPLLPSRWYLCSYFCLFVCLMFFSCLVFVCLFVYCLFVCLLDVYLFVCLLHANWLPFICPIFNDIKMLLMLFIISNISFIDINFRWQYYQ